MLLSTAQAAAAPSDTEGDDDDDDAAELPSAILMAERRRGGSAGMAPAVAGNRVRVTLDTEYPFGETLKFSVLAEVRLRVHVEGFIQQQPGARTSDSVDPFIY
eukprot:COSAG06_NODE_1137_length_10570_cov_6.358227_10_plen_103_part_00